MPSRSQGEWAVVKRRVKRKMDVGARAPSRGLGLLPHGEGAHNNHASRPHGQNDAFDVSAPWPEIELVLHSKSARGWSGIETVEALCAGGGRIRKTDGLLQRCRVRKFLIHVNLNVVGDLRCST